MKRIILVVLLAGLCISALGQSKERYLSIEIGDVATPVAGCHMASNHPINHEFQMEEEGGESPIYDALGYGFFHYPLFHGGYVDECCSWISKKLVDILSPVRQYSCDVRVCFTVKDDCSVVDVIPYVDNKFKDDMLIASIVSDLLIVPNCWSAPMEIKNNNYNSFLYLHIKMKKFSPNRYKKIIIRDSKFEFTDMLVNDFVSQEKSEQTKGSVLPW